MQAKQPSRFKLLDRIDAWLAITGLAENTLSRMILHNSDAIGRLRAGGSVMIDSFDFAMKWLDDNPAETWRDLHRRGPKPKSGNMEHQDDRPVQA